MPLRPCLPFRLLAYLFLMTGLLGATAAQAAPKVGDTLPLFDLPRLSDTRVEQPPVSLAELAQPKNSPAPKALLVVFFASYCQPCKAEFPQWIKLYKTYGPQGLALLMVNADYTEEGAQAARDFVAAQNPPFPVVSDRLALVSNRYFDNEATLPSAFIADSSGKLHGRYLGSEGRPERMEEEVKGLLSQVPVTDPQRKNEGQRLMVWRLERKSDAVKDEEIDSISGVIIAEVGRVSGKTVLSEYDVRTMLKKEETVQRCGLQNNTRECMLEIGGALDLPGAVSGDLGHIGETWIFNLRLTNLSNRESAGRASRQVEGSLDDVMDVIPGMVAEIFGKPIPPTPATLTIKGTPSGFLAFDGQTKLGNVPLKKRFAPGEYELSFAAPGYLPAKRHLVLDAGAKQEIEINLEKRPLSSLTIAGHATFWPGLVLAGLGGVFAWQAHEQSDARRAALNQGRFSAAKSAHQRSKVYSHAGTASFVLGGAALISGIVLWALAPSQAQHDEAADGGSLLAQGRF